MLCCESAARAHTAMMAARSGNSNLFMAAFQLHVANNCNAVCHYTLQQECKIEPYARVERVLRIVVAQEQVSG